MIISRVLVEPVWISSKKLSEPQIRWPILYGNRNPWSINLIVYSHELHMGKISISHNFRLLAKVMILLPWPDDLLRNCSLYVFLLTTDHNIKSPSWSDVYRIRFTVINMCLDFWNPLALTHLFALESSCFRGRCRRHKIGRQSLWKTEIWTLKEYLIPR